MLTLLAPRDICSQLVQPLNPISPFVQPLWITRDSMQGYAEVGAKGSVCVYLVRFATYFRVFGSLDDRPGLVGVRGAVSARDDT